jgi:hypothetical protein
MSVSGVSSLDTLATMASEIQGAEMMAELEAAILKQIQDQQEMFGDALVNMINQSGSLNGSGQILDLFA